MIDAKPRRQTATVLTLVIAAVLPTQTCRAEYLYISDDPLEVHEHFVSDMQNGTVNTKNFSAAGKQGLERLSNGTMRFPEVASAGAIRQVCETIEVQFPKGQSLTFRTMHEQKCLDWIVTLSTNPEEIVAVIYMGRPRTGNACGPPAILPPINPNLPAAGQIIPPINDCTNSAVRKSSATPDDVAKACSLWPKMCE